MKLIFTKTLIVEVLILLLLLGGCFRSASGKDSNSETPSLGEANGNHPLSVEGLKERVFQLTPFTIEKEHGDMGGYLATELSFLADGLKQYTLLSLPLGDPPESGFPVIILNHGYIPPSEYSTLRSYQVIYSHYSRNGFAVLKPDYRGHGRSEGREMIDSYLQTTYYAIDVLQLIHSLETLPYSIDREALFLYGHSLGGEVTMQVLEALNNSERVKAATLWAPVSVSQSERNYFYIGRHTGHSFEDIDALFESELAEKGIESRGEVSYLDYLSLIKTPLLLQHGSSDALVPIEWSTHLTSLFDSSGVSYQTYIYENDDHNISYNQTLALKRDREFFTVMGNLTL